MGDYSDINRHAQGRLIAFLLERPQLGLFEHHQEIVERVPGALTLYGSQEFPAIGVWAQGADVRALVLDCTSGNEGSGVYYSRHGFSFRVGLEKTEVWRQLQGRQLGAGALAPLDAWPPVIENPNPDGGLLLWQASYSGERLEGAKDGLYLSPSRRKLASGHLIRPVTMNDRWAVATLLPKPTFGDPGRLVRVDLQSGEVTPFDLPAADDCWAIARVPGGVLAMRECDKNEYRSGPTTGPEEPEYHVLDPATMSCRPVAGEFRPWKHTSERPLQPTGRPGEVWAALADKTRQQTVVGRYDTTAFTFEPVVTYPGLRFNSDDMWIDGNLVYVLCGGSVVRLPLP